MSSYYDDAFHPEEGIVRRAFWIDDFFGPHQYGIRFDDNGPVFRPSEVGLDRAGKEITALRAEIVKLRTERDKAHAAGLREGAEALTRWSSDTQIMKLAMGEMTAQEVRSVVAALKQRSAAIRARAEAVSPDLHKTSKQGETGNDA